MTVPRRDLWSENAPDRWYQALARYPDVVALQGVARLPALDDWYRDELPATLASRSPQRLVLEELIQLTEWKMARGVWRAPNLVLVRGNQSEQVISTSIESFGLVPHPTKPIAKLATLAGVGPATASAVVAALHPAMYPFFDELVAAQVPSLGKVAWTVGYYAQYASALRERAQQLGGEWTPTKVERALWAHCGGKIGVVG